MGVFSYCSDGPKHVIVDCEVERCSGLRATANPVVLTVVVSCRYVREEEVKNNRIEGNPRQSKSQSTQTPSSPVPLLFPQENRVQHITDAKLPSTILKSRSQPIVAELKYENPNARADREKLVPCIKQYDCSETVRQVDVSRPSIHTPSQNP